MGSGRDVQEASLPAAYGYQESFVDSFEGMGFTYKNQQQGIRNAEGLKLIRYQVNGQTTTQLFNLEADPWEQHDLSKVLRYQAVLENLIAQLDKEVQPLQSAQASRQTRL